MNGERTFPVNGAWTHFQGCYYCRRLGQRASAGRYPRGRSARRLTAFTVGEFAFEERRRPDTSASSLRSHALSYFIVAVGLRNFADARR